MRARKYRFHYSDEPLWTPLESFADLTRGRPDPELVVPCDFMMMGEVVHRRGHRLYVYKHYWTRRYLNVDADGHAFRYAGEVEGEEMVSWYQPRRSVAEAVAHLQLWMVGPCPPDERCERCRAHESVPSPYKRATSSQRATRASGRRSAS